MYFPALFSWARRLGRWLLYGLFQVALGVAFALHLLGTLRSALGGGGANAAGRHPGPAVRPRRPEARRARPRFTNPAAA
ncbi:hypothetical protein ACFQ48_10630 [Hymenobacter caeli]|uniref:Uncharacterized protein n=1 Tax=Hymenobacter caeli TaxID=2735894 RepID=A0ABX2FTH5_9BACT|nr:hypothetical protein [Hymenobacter caeli]NRT19700.1 hypothetical protein [Hymenobacter caeli]